MFKLLPEKSWLFKLFCCSSLENNFTELPYGKELVSGSSLEELVSSSSLKELVSSFSLKGPVFKGGTESKINKGAHYQASSYRGLVLGSFLKRG